MKPIEDSSEQQDSVLQTKTGPVADQERPFSIEGRQVVAGRYAILGQLGRGGMGEVWHAFDLKLRVDVALKSLRSDRVQQDVEALRREVRTAREVISPNVCRIFDLVVEDQQELVSMEYIDGITLAELLQKNNSLELQKATDIASQFLAGLQAIHQAGLVHRDFKPENVMITRTGRVVVMDFGIAKPVAQFNETISGTPSYMAPEQLQGRKLDPRSDIFAAGVVLAEMIQPDGVRSGESREALLKAIRQEPLQLPDHPWKKIITQGVDKNPDHRFPSAAAMARALEEVTQRTQTAEDRKPYPGLSAFTENDTEFFFGRELEVESILKKLHELYLMAIIGPSGAGKTSLLRAGLIPALPESWSHVLSQPGDAPLVNLAQKLAPQFAGDMEAIQKLVLFENLDTALWMFRRWRQKHTQCMLIIDRFEELFTLNPPEVQARFAELIGQSVLEADLRVVLVMRDDFLMFCKEYPPLAPIFSELTAIMPLTGAPLRRALVQPALKCGYRFEDETFVDEIIAHVEKERGALPLLAFAAARLWEKRDREFGLLTRESYAEIGSVAGALAQHAEATLERIGTERQSIVREIFRNLITAQNTRAARDTEELLSVFSNRKDAEEVLRVLIDARLLTSFEVKDEGKSHLEIIHESLLTAWPRLVRWQTQDADSAQLRDQLRQAAQMWEQRNRSQDLLWTGTAFLEFQAWRQRYPGRLTTTEEAFAQAMTKQANKRRRKRRVIVAVAFAIVLAIAVTLGLFWQRSEVSLTKAEAETRRAEASKLLALAQLDAESYPTSAIAYAIKSLELSDTMEARMFALKITQQAQTAILMPANQKDGLEAHVVDFSPDGKWIAVGGYRRAQVRSLDGKGPIFLSEYPGRGFKVCFPTFGPNSDRLITNQAGDMRVLSIPAGKELLKWKLGSEDRTWMIRAGRGLFISMGGLFIGGSPKSSIYSSTDVETEPQLRGEIPALGCLDLTGTTLLYTGKEQTKVYARSLTDWNQPPRFILEQPDKIRHLAIHPAGKQFASIDVSGTIRIWSIDPPSNNPLRIMHSEGFFSIVYDPTGSRLAAFGEPEGRSTIHVWDLTAPAGSEPLSLRSDAMTLNGWAFHPSGKWIATANVQNVALWPLQSKLSKTLPVSEGFSGIAFSPDGRYLLSGKRDSIQSWPLSGRTRDEATVILKDEFTFPIIQIDPKNGRFAVCGRGGRVLVANLDGSEVRTLKGYSPENVLSAVAFGAEGRFVAAAPLTGPKKEKVLRVWNVESGEVEVLAPLTGAGEGFIGGIDGIEFVDNNRILLSGREGLQLIDINTRKTTLLSNIYHQNMAISHNRRFVLASECDQIQGPYRVVRVDLESNDRTVLGSFGDGVALALDPSDKIVLTGSSDGQLRVGQLSGQKPHILFAHKGAIVSVAFSPDGHWIASKGMDGKIRITPMPDLTKPAPHTLSHDEFLAKLKSFTNLRVMSDPKSSTGWKVEVGEFPGWEKMPTW